MEQISWGNHWLTITNFTVDCNNFPSELLTHLNKDIATDWWELSADWGNGGHSLVFNFFLWNINNESQ